MMTQRNRCLQRWFQCACLIFCLAVWGSFGVAQASTHDDRSKTPVPVQVFFTIDDLSQMDAKADTFTLYYTLSYTWQGEQKAPLTIVRYNNEAAIQFLKSTWTPGIRFGNTAEKPVVISRLVTTDRKGMIRVDQYGYVTLQARYHFKNYPFDTQTFPISVRASDPAVVIQALGNSVDISHAAQLLSWRFKGLTYSTQDVPDYFHQEQLSELSISLTLKRSELFYITKMYVPLFIFMFITCAVVCYPNAELRFKIPILLTCLVLISLFSLRVLPEIPHVSYLTRLDKMVGVSRLWLVLVFLYSLIRYFRCHSRGETAETVFSKKQLIVPGLFLVLYLCIWLYAVLSGILL